MPHISKLVSSFALVALAACQTPATIAPAEVAQSIEEIESCVRAVMKLDEGTWNYMGVNARGDSLYRPYITTSVHASAGQDTWSNSSFGGDTPEEEANELSYVRLVGNQLVPLEDGELQMDRALTYTSCKGPDITKRYTTTMEYSVPLTDDIDLSVENMSWIGEFGSYFVEDLRRPDGLIVARRSGISWPVEDEAG